MKPELDTSKPFDKSSHISPGEIIIGLLVSINHEHRPLVDFAENNTPHPLVALSTVEILKKHVGRQVALLFANGDPGSPVIMGLIHSPLDVILENHTEVEPDTVPSATDTNSSKQTDPNELTIDGKRVLIEAKDEIELKCGESSIVLTKAGKILIRGKYVLSRSSGVNRIMGGSVQIN